MEPLCNSNAQPPLLVNRVLSVGVVSGTLDWFVVNDRA